MNFKNMKPEELTPQSVESNDGRLSVKLIDENYFELTMTELSADDKQYMNEKYDNIQKLTFSSEEIDRLIDILEYIKQINPYSWGTIKDK